MLQRYAVRPMWGHLCLTQSKTSNKIYGQQEAFAQIKKQMAQNHSKLETHRSVIKQFRKDVISKDDVQEKFRQIDKILEKQGNQIGDLVSTGSKESILKKSKQIGQRIINKQPMFNSNSSSLISDRGDYSIYESAQTRLEDRKLGEMESLKNVTSISRLYNFVNKIGEEFQENYGLKQTILNSDGRKRKGKENNPIRTISDYGKKLQSLAEIAQVVTQTRRDRFQGSTRSISRKKYPLEQHSVEYTGINSSVHHLDFGNGIRATLSPQAVTTIFQLYVQGWTVRDICHRFGILPARAKFCIWARAQLYYEMIPRLGMQFYVKAVKLQKIFLKTTRFCDYGIDLEWMNNAQVLESISTWSDRYLDAGKKDEKVLSAMTRLEKMNKFNKYEWVTVGKHGKNNKMHRLVEWRVFRGKGSDLYHLKHYTFRKHTIALKKSNKIYY